jgi:hypothetical protein
MNSKSVNDIQKYNILFLEIPVYKTESKDVGKRPADNVATFTRQRLALTSPTSAVTRSV